MMKMPLDQLLRAFFIFIRILFRNTDGSAELCAVIRNKL